MQNDGIVVIPCAHTLYQTNIFMKRIIPIIFAAVTFASCSNNTTDSAVKQQETLDSMKAAMGQQHTIDSMNAATAALQNAQAPANHEVNMAATHTREVIVRHHEGGHTVTRSNNSSNNYNNSATVAPAPVAVAPAPAPQPQKRRGWTGAEKGALIGAGAGALSGALIDGKKGEGAIVGGLLGAGAGAGAGALIQRKQNKKAEQQQQQQQGQ
jgi:hypothetical protein